MGYYHKQCSGNPDSVDVHTQKFLVCIRANALLMKRVPRVSF
jgi:hypothetical protein